MAAGESVYYAADNALWRSGPLAGLVGEQLAKLTCLALAASESTVYCATSGSRLADGHILGMTR